ncbi:hypothetical protein [Morganella psychrotolerans]|uniref:hypothetical protein n=1 Tax=Morganella psychrotolerans TaxID=368603 RepID=UPI001F2862EC|nr:hypothetical protein [Morganella psychrotolerans]
MDVDNFGAIEEKPDISQLTQRQKILIELFDGLPDSEADELLKALEEKKTAL